MYVTLLKNEIAQLCKTTIFFVSCIKTIDFLVKRLYI